ncbi:hypothetical protein ACFFV7_45020 [Nonomuraea spiralis]|uniref:Uncharacterized protein n=1 Tax=Nonomuraea spiralis TaxID=46182 RepID=A0ABV5IXE5_9ACTN|nr:hypothetical protein [Nonomuraea spiralis]
MQAFQLAFLGLPERGERADSRRAAPVLAKVLQQGQHFRPGRPFLWRQRGEVDLLGDFPENGLLVHGQSRRSPEQPAVLA